MLISGVNGVKKRTREDHSKKMPLMLGQTDVYTISSITADSIHILPILNKLNMPQALLFTLSVLPLVTVDGGCIMYCFI